MKNNVDKLQSRTIRLESQLQAAEDANRKLESELEAKSNQLQQLKKKFDSRTSPEKMHEMVNKKITNFSPFEIGQPSKKKKKVF